MKKVESYQALSLCPKGLHPRNKNYRTKKIKKKKKLLAFSRHQIHLPAGEASILTITNVKID